MYSSVDIQLHSCPKNTYSETGLIPNGPPLKSVFQQLLWPRNKSKTRSSHPSSLHQCPTVYFSALNLSYFSLHFLQLTLLTTRGREPTSRTTQISSSNRILPKISAMFLYKLVISEINLSVPNSCYPLKLFSDCNKCRAQKLLNTRRPANVKLGHFIMRSWKPEFVPILLLLLRDLLQGRDHHTSTTPHEYGNISNLGPFIKLSDTWN